jgi:hypothetical protein
VDGICAARSSSGMGLSAREERSEPPRQFEPPLREVPWSAALLGSVSGTGQDYASAGFAGLIAAI